MLRASLLLQPEFQQIQQPLCQLHSPRQFRPLPRRSNYPLQLVGGNSDTASSSARRLRSCRAPSEPDTKDAVFAAQTAAALASGDKKIVRGDAAANVAVRAAIHF